MGHRHRNRGRSSGCDVGERMIPLATQKSIYASIPRYAHIPLTTDAKVAFATLYDVGDQVRTGDQIYIADVQWAGTANISRMLKNRPIAVSVKISGDARDESWSSPGMLDSITPNGDISTVTRKQYRRATISLSVYAVAIATTSAEDIIDAYIEALQMWIMSDLRDTISVTGEGDVQDLSYLENTTARRDVIIYVRYPQTVTKTIDNIADIEVDVTAI